MATLIKTDGTRQEVRPKNGTYFSLDELQACVGGYIEFIYLNNELMVVNEEGVIYSLPLNARASEIAGMPIVGDVLICREKEVR